MSSFTDDIGRTWEVEDFVGGGLYANEIGGAYPLEYQWFTDEDLRNMGVDRDKLIDFDMKRGATDNFEPFKEDNHGE